MAGRDVRSLQPFGGQAILVCGSDDEVLERPGAAAVPLSDDEVGSSMGCGISALISRGDSDRPGDHSHHFSLPADATLDLPDEVMPSELTQVILVDPVDSPSLPASVVAVCAPYFASA